MSVLTGSLGRTANRAGEHTKPFDLSKGAWDGVTTSAAEERKDFLIRHPEPHKCAASQKP